MMLSEKTLRVNTELAIEVGVAHYHLAIIDRSSGEIRSWCSRTIDKGNLVRVADIWNTPQTFKATFCARCDLGLEIPSRAAQLLYLKNNIIKRLSNLSDDEKEQLDRECLNAWRLEPCYNPWSGYWNHSTFDLVSQTLNQNRIQNPGLTIWEMIKPYSLEELEKINSVIDGIALTDYYTRDEEHLIRGTLVNSDHA